MTADLARIPLAGVIGAPIAHSRSPALHGYWLRRYGIKGHYIPMEVAQADLREALQMLPRLGFVGLNVTIPHKETVLALADIVTDRAALIGATVGSLDRLAALAGAPIDYIGVGAVFGTASKGRPVGVLGLDGLAAICAASPWPVVAIGGVTAGSVREVLAAGAWGVAVLGGVVLADDPAAATAAYARAVFG
jgi:shikimate 5-dehydrogenase